MTTVESSNRQFQPYWCAPATRALRAGEVATGGESVCRALTMVLEIVVGSLLACEDPFENGCQNHGESGICRPCSAGLRACVWAGQEGYSRTAMDM